MKQILIIEDDADLQHIYAEELASAGYDVITSSMGTEGFNLAKYHKPDLIILDLMLPGHLNGFDLIKKIKDEDTLKSTPIIVLSNLDAEEKSVRAMGITEFFVKSNTSLSVLVEGIHKILI
jgi:DNA-binding response OmpR family regulator